MTWTTMQPSPKSLLSVCLRVLAVYVCLCLCVCVLVCVCCCAKWLWQNKTKAAVSGIWLIVNWQFVYLAHTDRPETGACCSSAPTPCPLLSSHLSIYLSFSLLLSRSLTRLCCRRISCAYPVGNNNNCDCCCSAVAALLLLCCCCCCYCISRMLFGAAGRRRTYF